MKKADTTSGKAAGTGCRKAFDPKAKTAKEAIAQVAMANVVLANEGIFDYLGHVSARNPEEENTFFISRSCAPEMVRKKDILEVDLEGKVLPGSALTPYREQVIHGAIYRARPDVHAVLHAHPLQIIIFSVLDIPVRPIAHFACRFYEDIPVYDEYDFTSPGATGMLVTTKKEADRLATRLGQGKAMLMRGHGFNVVAPNIPELVQRAITLRDNVLIQLAAHQLGTPKYLTAEEARHSSNAFIGVGVERGWNYWVARAKKAYPDLK
jgi:ribulose-5-phosphate 4-epimerase/fuculose-1-phosphate aldolase